MPKRLSEVLTELHPNLTIYKLAKISGVSGQALYNIDIDMESDIKLSTLMKIYQATLTTYGRGLMPWDYLYHADFSQKESSFTK